MMRWLALLAVAVIVVVLGVIVRQVYIEFVGAFLGIAAIALLAWSLQPSDVVRSLKRPAQPTEGRHSIRRSVTAALHAAIFSNSSSDTEE